MQTTSRSASRLALLPMLALVFLASGCEDDVPSEASGAEALLTMTEKGAGALTAETLFSPEALREALPEGFEIESGRLDLPGDTIPVLYVFSSGQMILEVFPDASRQRIRRIDASSDLVTGPSGVRAGARFNQVGGKRMRCVPGTEDLSGRALCTPRGGGPIRLVFAHGAETARGELPGRGVMAQSVLERIVWMAP